MILQREVKGKGRSIIDLIWYVDEEQAEKRRNDIVAPSGHIHLVYNFGDPYCIVSKNNLKIVPDIVLVGQYKDAIHLRYGEKVKMLGLAIHPWALESFMFQTSGQYTENIVDCKELESLKSINEAIVKIVKFSQDGSEVLKCVEEYLESCHFSNVSETVIRSMVAYIEVRQGCIDVKTMAKAFGYSISSLERKFKKYIGLSPKAYANIVRFRQAAQQEDHQSLFYDQSHYIKNCRKYTDKVPADIHESAEISLPYTLGIVKD